MTTNDNWIERFNKRFTVGETYWKPEKRWQEFGNQTQADEVKSFFQKEIDLAVKGESKRVAAELKKKSHQFRLLYVSTNLNDRPTGNQVIDYFDDLLSHLQDVDKDLKT